MAGREAEIAIDDVGRDGEGVGRLDGLVVFVPGALPGDVCRVRIEGGRRTMARASLLQVVRPSPARRAPPCPVFGRCGGCALQHFDYAAQLRAKHQRVVETLARIGGIETEVEECRPSPSPWGYRAKLSWPVRARGQGVAIGLYARGSHEVVEHDECAVAQPALRSLPALLRELCAVHGVPGYDEAGDRGVLRHVVARRSRATGQILVALVLRRPHPGVAGLARALMQRAPDVAGVAQNLNAARANRVFGSQTSLLCGVGQIEERLLGLSFVISPTAFFQVNPAAAELLFETALARSGVSEGVRALDLYCGTGVIALLLAREGAQVLGVEQSREAVADARRNAERNGLAASFEAADAATMRWPTDCDLLTVDPPRQGAASVAGRIAATRAPRRVVYVSCDPATFARDAALIAQGGYRLERVAPFDFFPQTPHVELVGSFVRCAA